MAVRAKGLRMADDPILKRLNGDFRRLAEIVGVENALKVSKEFGGLWISVPKLDDLKREERNASIREEYDSAQEKTDTVRSLARKHNLTARQIYNILGVQPDETDLVLPLFFSETQAVK
ncbi:MAG: Mor transcription activator family protein [Syntrophorhabdaceae bacterium]